MRCEIPESRLLAAKFGAKSRQEFEFPGRHWKPVHSIKRAWRASRESVAPLYINQSE